MAQIHFDTLKFVETLAASGFLPAQARTISAAVKDSHEAIDVATRRDLEDVSKAVSVQISEVRKDIDMMRKDLIIKMGGMLVVTVGILAAIIKLPS